MNIKIFVATSILLVFVLGNISFADDGTSVLVKTQKLTRQTLEGTLTGYGIITPDVGSTVSINLPRAGRITYLLVTPGQAVKQGQKIIEFATDPTANQAYKQAEMAVEYAKKELKRTEDIVAEKLATQSQLAQARKSLSDAEAALETQKKTGTGKGTENIYAPFDGLVINVPVAQGDYVQPGITLMQIAHTDALRVQLGIEPEDKGKVRPGMPVYITSVFGSGVSINAKVDEVQDMINPQTQLIDAVVRLRGKQSRNLIPGTRVQGTIKINSEKSWTVPRDALLKDESGSYIYQVSQGKAHKLYVKKGIETDKLVGIAGKINPGLPVVVQGNYELQDGMSIRER
jgi:membrane fusion protein (multidrug efflux system)